LSVIDNDNNYLCFDDLVLKLT